MVFLQEDMDNMKDFNTDCNFTYETVDQKMLSLKYLSYGIIMPSICTLGIIGNILNLVVLTRPNMRGIAYIYMRGYATAALFAILGAFPFCFRIIFHHELGQWYSYPVAFYHVHLELYVGNSCLGAGMFMLVSLTMERYISICFPTKARERSNQRRAHITVVLIPVICFLCYIPYSFGCVMVKCLDEHGISFYSKRDNIPLHNHLLFKIYRWFLEASFRFIPAVTLAYLNVAIIFTYRKIVKKRRLMTNVHNRLKQEHSEDNRLMLLLGSTSTLFFVCIIPIMIVSLMMSEKRLSSFEFQLCRAAANILEVTSYALTFYIYCIFSKDFRRTFLNTLNCCVTLRKLKEVSRFDGMTYLTKDNP